jgi:hypothetical protein
MMDELYTNLTAATTTTTAATCTITNDKLQALHEQLADEEQQQQQQQPILHVVAPAPVSPFTTTTTIATPYHHRYHHPQDRAMMTLLEASLPPTIEIKHILKNLYELQQSKQETQTHDEPITTSKPAVVATVHEEIISLLSRILHCQTKMKKTRITMM